MTCFIVKSLGLFILSHYFRIIFHTVLFLVFFCLFVLQFGFEVVIVGDGFLVPVVEGDHGGVILCFNGIIVKFH